MGIWSVVVTCVACLVVGFLIGIVFSKAVAKTAGSLIVDPYNPEVNGGVYTVFDSSPFEFHDKQVIKMDVIIADVNSQQNQGA